MTAAHVAAVVDGAVAGQGEAVLTGAEVDSRLVRPGDLFVALPGARRDGHEFVSQALATAGAALVRSDAALPVPPAERALVRVRDPLAAYHRLARYERVNQGWRVVAITGSVGKTTTKEMIGGLLGGGLRVGLTRGNRNSTLGLPAQLLSQPAGLDVMVAEAGMSRAGELDTLGAILAPEVVVYTRIAVAHTEFFDGIGGVIAAKAELLGHLDPDGCLILNAADEHQADFAAATGARVLRFAVGDDHAADVRLRVVADRGLLGSQVELVLPDGTAAAQLGLAGAHQVENLAAAAAAAHALGVSVAEIAAAVAGLRAAPRRGEIVTTAAGVTLIDDSYNASPAAMARMLELLARVAGRRVAVLGEMYELGGLAAAAHRELGVIAAGCCDLLVAVGGEHAQAMAAAARAAGGAAVEWTADAAAATVRLAELLRRDDVVLVKGSRGVGLDRTVDHLRAGGDG